jgi:hypothetical protein
MSAATATGMTELVTRAERAIEALRSEWIEDQTEHLMARGLGGNNGVSPCSCSRRGGAQR